MFTRQVKCELCKQRAMIKFPLITKLEENEHFINMNQFLEKS